MATFFNYFWTVVLVLAALGMTYLNLQRDVGVYHWLVVALMFAGAYYQYQKAGQVAE